MGKSWDDFPGRVVLNGLDLFSGIGGLSIALEPWVRTVAYCERDRYAQGVLLSRQREGRLNRAPIWDDVTTLRGNLLGAVDIITGGFPCQDISAAGLKRGLGGERSGLVFEIFRLVRECRPRFIFLENVPDIVFRGLDRILLDLHAMGFDARWTVVSAAEVGADHFRERWFLAAHSHRERIQAGPGGHVRQKNKVGPYSIGGNLSPFQPATYDRLLRTPNGISPRVDCTRCLGNAVVPLQARDAFARLFGIEGGR